MWGRYSHMGPVNILRVSGGGQVGVIDGRSVGHHKDSQRKERAALDDLELSFSNSGPSSVCESSKN